MCMWLFNAARSNLDRITAFLTLVILDNFLHRRVQSLCNQLLLQFCMDHFETMHACGRNIENVHVCIFADKKIFFDKITAFSTQTILRLAFNKG